MISDEPGAIAPIAVTFDALILHEATDISSDTFYAWSFAGAGFVIGSFAGIITGFILMLLSRKSAPTAMGHYRDIDDLLEG